MNEGARLHAVDASVGQGSSGSVARAAPVGPLDGTPYRFVARLGAGTMGEVVEAVHAATGRRVVVKLLRREHADRADLVDRLRLEAETIALVAPRTPHVPAMLDVGRTAEGRPYLVMERLEGRTLRAELKERGALPPSEAIALTRQVLAGLGAAHEAGVLHRDVKPDNVFLTRGANGERVVKLLDFGLAKVLRPSQPSLPGLANGAAAPPAATPAPLLVATAEGTTMGTPRYFAPEQAAGKAVGPEADLYATGALLYHLLTGRDPFAHHRGLLELVGAHLAELPAPPSQGARSALPPGLDSVVLRALEKRPEDRFASARDFDLALDRVVRGSSPRWAATEPLPDLAFLRQLPPATPVPSAPPVPSARTVALPVSSSLAFAKTLPLDPVSAPAAAPLPVVPAQPPPSSPWVDSARPPALLPAGAHVAPLAVVIASVLSLTLVLAALVAAPLPVAPAQPPPSSPWVDPVRSPALQPAGAHVAPLAVVIASVLSLTLVLAALVVGLSAFR